MSSPSSSVYTCEQLMMQPRMQLCLAALLGRTLMSSTMCSPVMLSAFSKVPAEKFFVARQPMDWVTFTRKAEPSASSAAIAGCERMPVGELPGGLLQRLRVGDAHARAALAVDDDGFEVLRTHDRAEAAAGGGAEVVVGGRDDDGGGLHLQLPGRADADERHLVAVLAAQRLDGRVRAQTRELRRGHELRPARAHLEHAELGGATVELEAAQAELRERARRRPAGVGLLDAAGERALAAHREPVAVRHGRAGEDARREDEHVAGPERVGGRLHVPRHDGRRESVAAEGHVLRRQWCLRSGASGQVDSEEVGQGRSHPFPGPERRPRSPFRRPELTRSDIGISLP